MNEGAPAHRRVNTDDTDTCRNQVGDLGAKKAEKAESNSEASPPELGGEGFDGLYDVVVNVFVGLATLHEGGVQELFLFCGKICHVLRSP